MKTCKNCLLDKPLDDFRYRADKDWHCARCRVCERLDHARYNKTPEKAESKRKYRSSEKGKAKEAEYRVKSKGKTNKRHKQRELTEPNFKLRCRVRTRIRLFIRNIGYVKQTKTELLLGCTWEQLRAYIEALFKLGMTWENYGSWHIDHKRPLSSFDLTNDQQLSEACHHLNLQPLWARENLSKSDKY